MRPENLFPDGVKLTLYQGSPDIMPHLNNYSRMFEENPFSETIEAGDDITAISLQKWKATLESNDLPKNSQKGWRLETSE